MSGNTADVQQQLLAPSNIIQKYVKTSLKGIHAYKNVSYFPVRISECHGCGLCQKWFFAEFNSSSALHIAVIEEHVRSDLHEARYSQLVRAQKTYERDLRQKRLKRSEFLREKTKQLVLPRWRWHMSALVMEYIDTPLPGNNERRYLRQALAQLAKYELMERLSLLELAIIKSQRCKCATCGGGTNHREHGNSGESNETLIKSGAAVIIPLVLQFLGKPPPIVE